MADRLNGYRILILETREEAQFSKLLTEQGADVLHPFDDLVLMTGEGLRRLVKAARRMSVEADFIASLKRPRKYARGPKPGRALREIGLEPQITTEKPTSEGMVEMLSRADLSGKRVGVQLYPDKDHGVLLGAIAAKGATAIPVTPYVYDISAADSHIVTAIEEMALGRIDAIALTNLGQIRRLFEVARAKGFEARLREGLAKTPIASVGPAVSDELKSHGLQADIYPDNDSFFMRPLISAMAVALAEKKPRMARY
jgi:uroporphyrinogen-III synthase